MAKRSGKRDEGAEVFPGNAAEPACPAHMTAAAQQVWREVAALMREQGTLSPAAGPALERYCEMLAQWRDLQPLVRGKHVLHNEEQDTLFLNPHVEAANKLLTQLRLLEPELFHTIARRKRGTAAPKDDHRDRDAAADAPQNPFAGLRIVG